MVQLVQVMKKIMKELLFTFLFFLTSAVRGEGLKDPSVTFEAVGKPSFIKIHGESNKLDYSNSVENKQCVDTFEILLDTLDSGMDLRNEHMKNKYLETKKYPMATLKIPCESASNTNLEIKEEKTVIGKLTLHGQTKDVSVHVNRNKDQYSADFEIKLTDYGIEIPSWAEITVADTVKIKTSFTRASGPQGLAR